MWHRYDSCSGVIGVGAGAQAARLWDAVRIVWENEVSVAEVIPRERAVGLHGAGRWWILLYGRTARYGGARERSPRGVLGEAGIVLFVSWTEELWF